VSEKAESESVDQLMLSNISQIKKIDTSILDQIVRELQSDEAGLERLWREPYPEYASAGMKVTTLLNPTGEQENFDYRDCPNPVQTPLLEKLPTLADFIAGSGLQIMGVRLLCLEPGTFLHEHRDFVYLEEIQRYRLHLPLITNDQAFITSPGTNVHFERGYLWKLDPKQTIHSACNFGSQRRVHMILDCYVNDTLAELLRGEFFEERLRYVLPPLTAVMKEQLIGEAKSMLPLDKDAAIELLTDAENHLLKTFCQYHLQSEEHELTSYDLLFELFKGTPFESRKNYWQERLTEVYPSRSRAKVLAK